MGWETFDIGRAGPMVAMGTMYIGAMVRARRLRLGLSQRTLAKLVVCDQSVISRLESGQIAAMRYRRFAILVAVLGGLEVDAPLPRWRTVMLPTNLPRLVSMDALDWAGLPYGYARTEVAEVLRAEEAANALAHEGAATDPAAHQPAADALIDDLMQQSLITQRE